MPSRSIDQNTSTITQPLWQPDERRINASNMLRFTRQLETNLGLVFEDYKQLHQWSIDQPEQFWDQLWQFCHIKASSQPRQILSQGDQFPGAKWFSGARLNFAENLLRNRSDKIALVSRLENGGRKTPSYAELYQQVSACTAALRRPG